MAFVAALMPTELCAELTCSPDATAQGYPTESDRFFLDNLRSWSAITKRRYVEGNSPKACVDFPVTGYEGFPTKKCTYKHSDEGDRAKPLSAKVVVLNPSAKQLASWSIHACRTNGASDATMPICLSKILGYIRRQNSAQFAVVGSVVESECNSSKRYSSCVGLPPNSPARAPRNTLFRNGVSISYRSVAHWTTSDISATIYDVIFDTKSSDGDIPESEWYSKSRVSGAERDDWIKWRQQNGKPTKPEGLDLDPQTFDLKGRGWGEVSRIVHQSACKSEHNELFDAIVFTKNWSR